MAEVSAPPREAPAFSMKSEKPSVRERLARPIKPLQELAQKREQRQRRRYTPDQHNTLKDKYKNTKNMALDITQDDTFLQLVSQKQAEYATARDPLAEQAGKANLPLASERARAMEEAFKEFQSQHPDLAEKYRQEGYHFKQDRDGNYSVDYKADPFLRGVEAQARQLEKVNDTNGSKAVWDKFARECPAKARFYAVHGHRELRDAVARIDAGTGKPASGGTPESQQTTTTSESQVVAIDNDQIAQITALSEKKSGKTATIRELNELKKLQKLHEQAQKRAQSLRAQLDDPNRGALTDEEVEELERLKPLLDISQQESTGQKNTGTQSETDPHAQNEAQKRGRGVEAINKLNAAGIDTSKQTLEQALQALEDRKIVENGTAWENNEQTREYIRDAYAEQQTQQAEAAINQIPERTLAALEEKGMKKADIIALILGLLAMGTFQVSNDVFHHVQAQTT